jgi:predicted nucleotidyltransferase component of viral defense system
MLDLIKQEQFEIEVLDRLQSGRFLERLVFGGGTMLRLCFGLDRYSIDLDFWLLKNTRDQGFKLTKWFSDLQKYIGDSYKIRDAANKFYSLVLELKSPSYPRSLKLEIRKGMKITGAERAIAYSRHSSLQVYVRTVSLQQMMRSKIDAFLQRKEIRDVYDMEFLVKKGVQIDISSRKATQLLNGIADLTRQDYNVKLCSLIEADQRPYYRQKNFNILKTYLTEKVTMIS